MANKNSIVKANVAGEFFVDTGCINCGVSRHFAPDSFGDDGAYHFIDNQPETEHDVLAVQRALLACPVGAIGARSKQDLSQARNSFPLELARGAYINGFNDDKSFGAHSYFIRADRGNWLIDSPRFNRHLVKRFSDFGGIDHIFLSHRDDVADADKYAAHFGAKRVIHALEAHAQRDAEIVLEGDADHDFGDARIVFTPGHTSGHMILVWREKYLFTGDHFAWLTGPAKFGSFRDHCWYSWDRQISSVQKLERFEKVKWVFPGHGMWGGVGAGDFPAIVKAAVKDMIAAR